MADVLRFIGGHFFLLRCWVINVDVHSVLSPVIEIGQGVPSVEITVAGEEDSGLAVLVLDVELGVFETPALLVEVVKLGLNCQ